MPEIKVKELKMPSNCFLDYIIDADGDKIHYATISNPYTGYCQVIDEKEARRIINLSISDNETTH